MKRPRRRRMTTGRHRRRRKSSSRTNWRRRRLLKRQQLQNRRLLLQEQLMPKRQRQLRMQPKMQRRRPARPAPHHLEMSSPPWRQRLPHRRQQRSLQRELLRLRRRQTQRCRRLTGSWKLCQRKSLRCESRTPASQRYTRMRAKEAENAQGECAFATGELTVLLWDFVAAFLVSRSSCGL